MRYKHMYKNLGSKDCSVQLLRKETQCATVFTFSTNLLYSSRRTLAVNLLTRHRVTVPANIALYNRTSLKFPSHSMRPNSPNKSKFVMPGEYKNIYLIRHLSNSNVTVRIMSIESIWFIRKCKARARVNVDRRKACMQ